MNIYLVCGWICPEWRESPVTRDVAAASRGTVPNRTVPYSTILYCAVRTNCAEDLTLFLSKKAKGKESRCGNRRKCGKLCGKLVSRWIGLVRPAAGRESGAPGQRRCSAGAKRSPGAVWCGPVDGCAVAVVRCGTRVQRRARWLAFFLREKTLDKLCKSILDWK